MTTKAKKVTYVCMKYDDGSMQELSGDAAQAWFEDVNTKITNAWIHGDSMKTHNWVFTPAGK